MGIPPFSNAPGNIQIGGNTAGATSNVVLGAAVFAGGNNITLSQNSNSITINAGNQTVNTASVWYPFLASPTQAAVSQGTLGIFPVIAPMNIVADRANLFISATVNNNATTQIAAGLTAILGIYTRNGSTLNLASSGSLTYAATNNNSASSSVINGFKNINNDMKKMEDKATDGKYIRDKGKDYILKNEPTKAN